MWYGVFLALQWYAHVTNSDIRLCCNLHLGNVLLEWIWQRLIPIQCNGSGCLYFNVQRNGCFMQTSQTTIHIVKFTMLGFNATCNVVNLAQQRLSEHCLVAKWPPLDSVQSVSPFSRRIGAVKIFRHKFHFLLFSFGNSSYRERRRCVLVVCVIQCVPK